MILLIGGTSETAPLAAGIVGEGYTVLVSTATDLPLAIGENPRIFRRAGRLDEEGLVALGKERRIRAIVDAAHPYAVAAHAAVRAAAERLGIPCLTLRRPEMLFPENGRPAALPAVGTDPVRVLTEKITISFAADHAEAAALAFADGSPVLVTTGSRNLVPYAAAARRTGIPMAARVLDAPESLAACRVAGVPRERIITGRGPFSIEENLAAIRRFRIGVIVTKESGHAGGLDSKLAAARKANCRVVILHRPEISDTERTFDNPAALIETLSVLVPKDHTREDSGR